LEKAKKGPRQRFINREKQSISRTLEEGKEKARVMGRARDKNRGAVKYG